MNYVPTTLVCILSCTAIPTSAYFSTPICLKLASLYGALASCLSHKVALSQLCLVSSNQW